MSNIDVVGIGSCTVDFFAIVPKLLGAEEKINAERMEVHAGGVTANNLTQIARLGAKVGWFGLIGDDDNGRIILDAFEKDNIDTSAIDIVPGERSSTTWIPVDSEGERCIYMFPNVTAKVSADQVGTRFAPYIRQAKHLHTEASQLPMAPVIEALRIARDAGVRTFFDLDVDTDDLVKAGLGSEADLQEALSLTDVLKPCKAGARALTGESDPERMARKLLTYGPEMVVVTLGADGAIMVAKDSDAVVHAPPFVVDVTDTTGAGDAFLGGLSYAMLQGWESDQVLSFANACAALCCTEVGARAMFDLARVQAVVESR